MAPESDVTLDLDVLQFVVVAVVHDVEHQFLQCEMHPIGETRVPFLALGHAFHGFDDLLQLGAVALDLKRKCLAHCPNSPTLRIRHVMSSD